MAEIKALQQAIDDITEIAKDVGLDFYSMRYEICPAEIIYTFGAYGMPTRFHHWSFGKQFHKMKLHYDLGLSQIYELVINSDPCYAFLLDTNSLIQNKLIIAHVLAHSDFFKNNARFAHTRKDMVESMTTTAERIADYEMIYGKQKVEQFLDDVLSIQEHIDPSPLSSPPSHVVPKESEKDVLLFIANFSHVLEDWQVDILAMMREEMIYFWPQIETKIMNEGWASYWHQHIVRELELTSEETLEFAKLHANVIQPSSTQINPYHLGIKLFESIESRYNHPTIEMKKRGIKANSGIQKIFEVREMESDQSFIRNYLTKELAEEVDLYLFQKQKKEYRIHSKEFEEVKEQLVSSRLNGGFPYIVVKDGDFVGNGELYLQHRFEGTEVDHQFLEKVLPHLYRLWGRPVHFETVMKGKYIVYSYDGRKGHHRYLQ